MDPTKSCPACAMAIAPFAIRCPHCRTRQPDAPALHRGHAKVIAGVCGALADELGLDPAVVRVAFGVLAALSAGLLCWAYAMLWLVTPPTVNGRAPLTRLVEWVTDLFNPGSSAPEVRR